MTTPNIFSQLGFSDREAAILEKKFYLGEYLREYIKRERLTPSKAAEFFGTTKEEISALINGDPPELTIAQMKAMGVKTGGKLRYQTASGVIRSLF